MTQSTYRIANRMHNAKPSFLRQILTTATRPGMISFAGGLPAPDLFDVTGIQQATETVLRELPTRALQYGPSDGEPELREDIVKIMRTRGANVLPDDIIITTGSQQGIDLIGKAMLDENDVVLLERPTYLAALQTFGLYQPEFAGVQIDANGMVIENLERVIAELKQKGKHAKLLYTVATFANPSGATMTIERRKQLLEIIVRENILLVEDDPYSELRFAGERVPTLRGLAEQVPGATERTVYLSSLSKIFSPGLRVAWMVVPAALKPQIIIGKQACDLHTSSFTQLIAHTYLASGALENRLPIIQAAYGTRANAMMQAIETHLPKNSIQYSAPQGGMFLWARMAAGVDTNKIVQRAIEENVVFVPGAFFYANDSESNTLRLSFATTNEENMVEGLKRMAKVIVD